MSLPALKGWLQKELERKHLWFRDYVCTCVYVNIYVHVFFSEVHRDTMGQEIPPKTLEMRRTWVVDSLQVYTSVVGLTEASRAIKASASRDLNPDSASLVLFFWLTKSCYQEMSLSIPSHLYRPFSSTSKWLLISNKLHLGLQKHQNQNTCNFPVTVK